MTIRSNPARIGVSAILLLLLVTTVAARSDQAPADAQPPADQIVRPWFDRWNAAGAGGAAVDALVALYEPTALPITGPSPDQRGTATYRGHDGIRVLAGRFAATEERFAYRIESETAREETAQLIHTTRSGR